MSDIKQIEAAARPGVGKGAARAVRRAGFTPAVIYGGKQEPLPIQIQLSVLLKVLQAGGFYTQIYDVMVDGEPHRVQPKEIQKNKLNGLPTHVDFLRVAAGSNIIVEIPVRFLNEETCVGLKRGGVMSVVRREVELSVPADAIPEVLEIDIQKFDIGDAIKISSVPLPDGVTPTITDRDFTIATISAPAGGVKDDDDAAEGEEA